MKAGVDGELERINQLVRQEQAQRDRMMEAAAAHNRRLQEQEDRTRSIADAAKNSLYAASECVSFLVEKIRDFETALDAKEEVALCFVGGPSGTSFFPTVIEPINPDKIVFQGVNGDGQPFMVIQHVSQLNFVIQVHKVHKEPARRIGFDIGG